MDISVIIVNHNAAGFLARCLASIEVFFADVTHEIYVVDNASTDGSLELIGRQFPRVQIIANDCNVGFTVSNNQGARRAKGRYILFLNPDTEFVTDGLKGLAAFMDERPEVGIVGPKLLNPDGTVQMSCRGFPTFRTALFNRSSVLTRLFPGNPFSDAYIQSARDHNKSRKVDWVSGACLLAKKTMLEKIGLFDERFFIYCEDVDLCRRAYLGGWKVYYVPEARVIHYGGQGGSHHLPYRMALEHHKSMWRYYTKHFRQNPPRDALVMAGIIARCTFKVACSVLEKRKKITRR